MRFIRPLFSSFALVAALSACAPLTDEASESAAASSIEAAIPTLTFAADWSETQSMPIIAPGRVRLRYDEARLPQCRGELNGRPAWTLTAFTQLAGGEVRSTAIAGYSPDPSVTLNGEALVDVAAPGELAVWFQVTNRWGCSAWDSDFGANYRFTAEREPVVRFASDWTHAVTGTPTAGAALTIDYDIARLPQCRQTYNGYATWEVLVFYRFDGGTVAQAALTTTTDSYTRVAAPARIVAPAGARSVEMWFKNSDRAGCVAWDSRYGANYTFGLR